MSGARFRKLLVVGAVVALVAALVRALRGEPAPQFAGHPSVTPRPEPAPDGAASVAPDEAAAAVEAVLAPVADRQADEPVEATPVPADPAPAPVAVPVVEAIAADGRTAFTVVDEVGALAPTAPGTDPSPDPATPPATDATWAVPVDGGCPEGFPVKAKLASGIFHQPGGLSYERTRPDRCYPSADAALADGLRAAKR